MPYVRTISYAEAEGELKETYDRLIADWGMIGNVNSSLSLRPHSMESLMDLTRQVMLGSSGLSKVEREMIGTVVSALNKCQY